MGDEEKLHIEAEGFACCYKILQMIACLHQRGYQQLRVFCYGRMMWWRGEIAPARLFSTSNPACMEFNSSARDEGLVADFGSAGACEPFGWGESIIPMPIDKMADRFVKRFPALARESRGSDWAYAGWFLEMLSHASAEKLPAAYAVDEHESAVFDPVRFYVYPTGYSEDTMPLPPSSPKEIDQADFYQAFINAWNELKAWMRNGRFAPQNEEDVQCFLYRGVVNYLKTAVGVRPKSTVTKRSQMNFPDFLLGTEKGPEVVIEIKFSRDGKTGATFEQCLEDIRKLSRLSKHKEFANTKRVFVVVDSRMNQVFLSSFQYQKLQNEDPDCNVFCFPNDADAFTESPAKVAGVTKRKQNEEKHQIRSQRAIAANATIKRKKALSEKSRIAPVKKKPAVQE